ncbi:cold-shock protein [Roseateles sp. BYS78W]|uniref:Cold-shock protein n=1 Tax=Pelomonas candidula TaxID=3299025 RepID=A0ABW7HF69_9BURK
MRFDGVLSAWNPDAGCGRIRPAGGGDEVFVVLGAFPTDGEGARLDEPLSFEIVTGRDGRKQAVNLQRRRLVTHGNALREATGVGQARVLRAQRKRRLSLAAGAVVTVMLVAGGVHWWPHSQPAEVPAAMRR